MTTDEELELRQLVWIHEQRRKCAAKDKFFSPAAAATKMRCAGSSRMSPKLYQYHCQWCGFWHNTSNKPRALREAA